MFFGKTNTDKSNLPLTRRIFGKTIHNAMVKDRADTQAKFNRSGMADDETTAMMQKDKQLDECKAAAKSEFENAKLSGNADAQTKFETAKQACYSNYNKKVGGRSTRKRRMHKKRKSSRKKRKSQKKRRTKRN